MQLTQKNYLPAFAFHGWSQNAQGWVLGELVPERLRRHPPAQSKRNGGSKSIACEHDKKSPPEAKKEASANCKYAARKQENITDCKQEWVTNRAPCSPIHHTLLQRLDKIDNREIPRKQGNQSDGYN